MKTEQSKIKYRFWDPRDQNKVMQFADFWTGASLLVFGLFSAITVAGDIYGIDIYSKLPILMNTVSNYEWSLSDVLFDHQLDLLIISFIPLIFVRLYPAIVRGFLPIYFIYGHRWNSDRYFFDDEKVRRDMEMAYKMENVRRRFKLSYIVTASVTVLLFVVCCI